MGFQTYHDALDENQAEVEAVTGLTEHLIKIDFKGIRICFTGDTGEWSREVLMREAEVLGARVSGSVSQATNLLVYGGDLSPKLEKAIALEIPAIPLRTYRRAVEFAKSKSTLADVTLVEIKAGDIDLAEIAHATGHLGDIECHLPPATTLEFTQDPFTSYYQRQIDWSLKTFGPAARTAGILAHVRKELVEIEAAPYDLMEWLDLATLALDGYHRHGGNPAMALELLSRKQAKNFTRNWPDWRKLSEHDAIEHDRSGE